MTDIINRLGAMRLGDEDYKIVADAIDEIGRLREALKTFADNVRETNAGIDENWAETIYPLKAENQRLREALQFYASFVGAPPHINVAPYIIDGGKIAASALKEGE